MSMEYNTMLFDASTIDNMITHFKNIIKEIVTEPKVSVSDIYFLSNEETIKIYDTNQTEKHHDSIQIDEIIAKKAEGCASQTAIICGKESLTYAQLESSALQIANILGTFPRSEQIAVCIPRSTWLVSSALAIWKVNLFYLLVLTWIQSGCVYVPLNPSFPDQRLLLQLQESGSKILITHSSVASRFSYIEGLQLLLVDNLPKVVKIEKSKKIHNKISYIMFTSGSTGKPKVPSTFMLKLIIIRELWSLTKILPTHSIPSVIEFPSPLLTLYWPSHLSLLTYPF
jgi:non-ribosomal peptide synthetase component F